MNEYDSMSELIEVSSEMLRAGVIAFYENEGMGWEVPGNDELKRILRLIYVAMAQASQNK